MQPEWEIWLDTNISPIIAKWMSEHTGLIVKSSYTLSLHYLTDSEIYQRAKEYGKVILISKDADFPELISRLGSPPKLVNLKIGNCNNKILWQLIKPHIIFCVNLLTTSDTDIVDIE